ncbi:hypothetical protein E5675_08930 [Sphingopyxis sp. PAMC25046]|uniref:hypothetical protein n=1 Tax=Sphingopyxis sp. PAMC25046 TaxID=2565556 RepID=UPI00109E0438|nr:hypothetical protein [Sphingopyxis sp. PAMC25046]QCB54547.1 hypothetical protein E5675_08930 [Sphingopyxis sp. PAMC25046]
MLSLDTGARTMCLNQLLEDEQLALMRYSAVTKPSEIMRYRRKIESLGQRFKSFPYHHRPYFPSNAAAGAIASPRPTHPVGFSVAANDRKDV